MRLMGRDNGRAVAEGQPRAAAFPKPFAGLTGDCESRRETVENQLFNSDLMRLSNSSKLWSPFIISPLMKKVGVEFTFSTSFAYF
jgi:hypothetical protein